MQWLWILFQTAITATAFTILKSYHPDLANSALGVASFFIAFLATAIPLAIYDLAIRIHGWRRYRRLSKQRPDQRLPADIHRLTSSSKRRA